MKPRNRLLFEADLGAPAGGAPAITTTDPSLGGEAAPAEPAWQGPSQEEWQEIVEQNQRFSHWQQQQALREAQQAQPQTPWDPFDEGFGERMARLEQMVQQFGQTHEQYRSSEGQARAFDIIADIEARDGEFLLRGQKDAEGKELPDSRQKAFSLAREYMSDAVQQFGRTDRAAEVALEWAYQDVREWEEAVGKAYHERQMNQLSTLAGARGEPGTTSPAQQLVGGGPYRRGERVTDRFFGGGTG